MEQGQFEKMNRPCSFESLLIELDPHLFLKMNWSLIQRQGCNYTVSAVEGSAKPPMAMLAGSEIVSRISLDPS